MRANWPLKTIAECASPEPYSTQIGPFGEKLRAHSYLPRGAPVLRGTNVNPVGRFHDDDFVFIDSDWAARDFDKFFCEADDVVLCHKGTLGKIGIIPKNGRFPKYVMGNSMLKVRCDRSKLEPLYLYYWLSSADGQNYLFSRVSQVGVPQIQRPLSTLREAALPIPPVEIQRNIARMLGALDDKIELNRRMNETLEVMVRALFRSWFVDFDPVRAKAEGRGPSGMDSETASLFPNAFIESELGSTPKGWGVVPLYEIATYINGAAYAAFQPNDQRRGLPIVKIAELKAGVTPQTGFSDVAMPEKYRIDARDILFSWSGNPDTSIDTFVWTHGQAWLNQHIFRVVPHSNDERSWVLSTLKYMRPVFAEIARNKQTTGLGHVTAGDMKRLLVVRPDERIMRAWSKVAGPLFDRVFSASIEAHTLTLLRDALLPRLLSGDVRVPPAQLPTDGLA